MKKLGQFIYKYRFFILVNLVIFISLILITSTVPLFGVDDVLANAYTFHPEYTFIDFVHNIYNRIAYWNAKIGEVLYFIVGCFPRYVYFFLNGLNLLLFLNLVHFYVYGKDTKEFLSTKKYAVSMLGCYVVILTIFPAFSEVIMWMGGACNHMWGTVIVLLAAIPFRLLLDNYDVFDQHKKLKPLYLFFCLLASFSVENAVPWLLLYMGIVILIYLKKRKLISWMLHAIEITFIGFIGICISSTTINRINFFKDSEWAILSKKYLITNLVENYKYLFVLIIILLVISFAIASHSGHFKDFKNKLRFIMIQFIISLVSIFIVYLAPYFDTRLTVLAFFFALTIFTYLLNNIFTGNISCIISCFCIIFIVFSLTNELISFYKDFNEFNELRYSYMKRQIDSGNKDMLCPLYDNKYGYFYPYRLVHYESTYCDTTYIKYLFDDEEATSNGVYIKIR